MLIIFIKRPRVHNMQGFWTYQSSEYTSVSEDPSVLKYIRVNRVLNMLEYAWLCLAEYAWICLNIPIYSWICPSALMAFVLYFSIVITCLLERVLIYFKVYTKLEVLVWRKMMLFLGETKIDIFHSSCNFIAFCFKLNIFTSKISNLLLPLWALWGRCCESWCTLF